MKVCAGLRPGVEAMREDVLLLQRALVAGAPLVRTRQWHQVVVVVGERQPRHTPSSVGDRIDGGGRPERLERGVAGRPPLAVQGPDARAREEVVARRSRAKGAVKTTNRAQACTVARCASRPCNARRKRSGEASVTRHTNTVAPPRSMPTDWMSGSLRGPVAVAADGPWVGPVAGSIVRQPPRRSTSVSARYATASGVISAASNRISRTTTSPGDIDRP